MAERSFKPSQEAQFMGSLARLSGIYDASALDTVVRNADTLLETHRAWGSALIDAAEELGVPDSDPVHLPHLLEKETVRRVTEKTANGTPSKTVLGISGPGATGKGTIIGELGALKVINTTTRTRRDYEIDGVDYHFVEEDRFERMKAQGAFVSVTHRPGRGNYGIQTNDLRTALQGSDLTIVEENPATLANVTDNVTRSLPDTGAVATYILPPGPVILHLAARLASRCKRAGEDFVTVIDSTLGSRQVDEFRTFVPQAANGVRALFVVNDNVERAVNVIKNAVSPQKN